MKLISFFILICILLSSSWATIGVDMSMQECSGMALSDWQCLVNQGFTFAIVQAFQGGNGLGPDTARCVKDAYSAGMEHVDIYIFQCPNGCGNDNASDPVVQAIDAAAGTNFGMVWFDIELCDDGTCWYSAATNAKYIHQAVATVNQLGYKAGIYSSHWEWGQVMPGITSFSSLPQWYADPGTDPAFDDSWAWSYGGWTSPSIKQYNFSGPCMGGGVDLNYYPS